MADFVLGVGLWFGISLVAVFMFALGAALGRRGAWEEGYQLGLQVGAAHAERRLRDAQEDETDQQPDAGQERKAG